MGTCTCLPSPARGTRSRDRGTIGPSRTITPPRMAASTTGDMPSGTCSRGPTTPGSSSRRTTRSGHPDRRANCERGHAPGKIYALASSRRTSPPRTCRQDRSTVGTSADPGGNSGSPRPLHPTALRHKTPEAPALRQASGEPTGRRRRRRVDARPRETKLRARTEPRGSRG